jgi:hypothetical protein
MKTFLASCALLLASFAPSAATFTFTGSNYLAPANFTPPCGTPSCANFTTSMHVSGFFSTSNRLPQNSPGVDITGMLSGGSFSDGLTTYAGNDPGLRVFQFVVITDANSNVTDQGILIERWQDGSAGPHVAGDRFDYFVIQPGGATQALHNRQCIAVGIAPSGVGDACTADLADGSDSVAASLAGPAFALAPGSGIPTLGEYALLLLAALMGIFGLYGVRRNNGAAA